MKVRVYEEVGDEFLFVGSDLGVSRPAAMVYEEMIAVSSRGDEIDRPDQVSEEEWADLLRELIGKGLLSIVPDGLCVLVPGKEK